MDAKTFEPNRLVRLLLSSDVPERWSSGMLLRHDDPNFVVQLGEDVGPLLPGSRIQLQITNQEGVHTCEAEAAFGEKSLFTFRRVGEYQSRQQRRYFRVTMTEPLELEVLNSKNPLFGKTLSASAVDLSIGGVGVHLSLPLDFEEVVRVNRVQDSAGIGAFEQIEAQVRYCRPTRTGLQAVGMEFLALSLKDQDRLAAWVIKLQVSKAR